MLTLAMLTLAMLCTASWATLTLTLTLTLMRTASWATALEGSQLKWPSLSKGEAQSCE